MGRISSTDLIVEVDYFQCYAGRVGMEWAADKLTERGIEEHLWSNGEFVYLGTGRKYGPVGIKVEVLDAAPGDPTGLWQHVAEVSLRGGGDLGFYSWGEVDPVAVVAVDPAPARLRVCWAGLEPLRFEGLDDDGNSDEHLLVQTWPAGPAPERVLRWWEGWELPPSAADS